MNRKLLALSFTVFFLVLVSLRVVSAKPDNSNASNNSQNNPSSDNFQKPDDENEDDSDEDSHKGKGKSGSVHLQSKNNKLQVTFVNDEDEDEDGDGDSEEESDIEEEVEEVDEFEIEEGDDGLKVRAHGNAALVIRSKLAAQTNFPLMVNLETNELIVTTPKGQKIVTVLPDKAVQNMLAANVLDQLGGKGGLLWLATQPTATPTVDPSATPSATITPSATPSATPSVSVTPGPSATPSGEPTLVLTPSATLESGEELPIRLVLTDDGVLAYEIDGEKFEKLLGLFKVKLKRLVFVSAETGELLEIKQNLATRVLDFLSVD